MLMQRLLPPYRDAVVVPAGLVDEAGDDGALEDAGAEQKRRPSQLLLVQVDEGVVAAVLVTVVALV